LLFLSLDFASHANNSGANPEEPLEQRPSGGFGPLDAFFNEKCGLAIFATFCSISFFWGVPLISRRRKSEQKVRKDRSAAQPQPVCPTWAQTNHMKGNDREQ
jgi:hypothetical protein